MSKYNFVAIQLTHSTHNLRIKISYLLLALSIIFLFSEAGVLQASIDIQTDVEKANLAIQKKLDYYNKTFPEIQFAHLKNGEEWYQSIQALELFIGYQATCLDYEHPDDLREELLFATIEKIRIMLASKLTTSYLFKVGQIPAAIKKHVCVITIDPASTIISNRVATEYFIDLSLEGVPASHFIDKDSHLDFIIDHEAFHCLDTFAFGGIPMSMKNFSNRHEIYRRETEADMFALAMHIKKNERITDYTNKIIALRGMSLLNGELQHFSVPGMHRVREYDLNRISQATTRELLKLVKQLYTPLALSYQQYLQYRVNAIEAIQQLGRTVAELDKPILPPSITAQKDKVRSLLQQTKEYYRAFFAKSYPLSNNP